jgi:hypothetical protein
MHDTINTGVGPMINILIFWISTSVILCLALLGAAARRVPRMNDGLEATDGLPLCPVVVVASDQAMTTGALARGKPWPTPVLARTATSAPLLVRRSEFGDRDVPLFFQLRPGLPHETPLVRS